MGDLSCGSRFGQIFLVFINSIFTLLGLALLVVGCLLKFNEDFITGKINELLKEVKIEDLNVDLSSILSSLSIVFIIAGAFVFVVGVLGCFGACCQWRPLLVIYAIIVLLLLILQIAAVAVTLTMRSNVDKFLKSGLNSTLEDKYYGDNATDTVSLAFNNLFFKLKCCGIDSYTDVQNARHWNRIYEVNGNTALLITPFHCCKGLGDSFPPKIPDDLTCATNPTSANSNFESSCYTKVEEFLQLYATVFIAVGVVTWVVEIFCIIFAFCMCREIGRSSSDKMV